MSSPARSSSPKTGDKPEAGVCLHITSLPGPCGIGDIGDAALSFLDQLAETPIRIWQILPVNPTGYGDSPYQALSAFAGNEWLIGLEPLVREGLIDTDVLSPLKKLPMASVDYGALIPLKRNVLNQAATRFPEVASAAEKARFEEFCASRSSWWLSEYALYRVLKSKHKDRSWTDWPGPLMHRESPAMQQVIDQLHSDIQRVSVIQYFFYRQWQKLRRHARSRGIRLFGDLPFYIALDSSDAWSEDGLLQIDRSGQPSFVAGVPPDYFSEDGQLWGNPLYDWKSLKNNGFRWWRDRVSQAAERFDMVRIDHFRAIDSFWSIASDETTARNGKWRPGPGSPFLDAIIEPENDLEIIAEDLGMLSDSVIDLRCKHNIPGMRVLQFELETPDFNIADIPADCFCYTGTHDNNTSIGWFQDEALNSGDQGRQEKLIHLTMGSAKSIHQDIISLGLSTSAKGVIAPMQDYLGLGAEARLNEPGNTLNNWRWRMRAEHFDHAARQQISRLIEAF